jgi:hypothetical protein
MDSSCHQSISLIQENINPKSGFFFFGEFWPLGDPKKRLGE